MGGHYEDVSRVVGGERVRSFRSCLRRYQMEKSDWISAYIPSGTWKIYNLRYSTCPTKLYYGFGLYTPGMTMSCYVASAYSGYRGSRRFKMVQYNRLTHNGDSALFAKPTDTMVKGGWVNAADGDTVVDHTNYTFWQEANKDSWRGVVIAAEPASKVLDFEVPFYSNQRFLPTTQESTTVKQQAQMTCSYRNAIPYAIIDEFSLDVYSSIGDDYNLFFFCGVPPIWGSA